MTTKSLKVTASFLFLFITSVIVAQPMKPAEPAKTAETKFPEANAFTKSNVTYKIINAVNNTYCYDIFADGKLLIHQPSVPGMQGNEGFKTKQSAEKVAQLVVTKIKKGEMPPTISKEEMQKLKAI